MQLGPCRSERHALTSMAMVSSWPMSESMALQVTRVCSDVRVSRYHRRPCGCLGSEPPPGSMSVFEGFVATGVMPIHPALPPSSMVTSEPEPLPRVMSGSMTLQQPGSDWIAMGPFITKGYVDTCGLISHLCLC